MDHRGSGKPPEKHVRLGRVEYGIIKNLTEGKIKDDGTAHDGTRIGIHHLARILRSGGHKQKLEDLEDEYEFHKDKERLRAELVSLIKSLDNLNLENVRLNLDDHSTEQNKESVTNRLKGIAEKSKLTGEAYTYVEVLDIYLEYLKLRTSWLVTQSQTIEQKIDDLLSSIKNVTVKEDLIGLVTNRRETGE